MPTEIMLERFQIVVCLVRAVRNQKGSNLPGIPDNRLRGFVSVGNPGGIAKVNEFFTWKICYDFFCYGEAANAGIEDSDGQLLICLHVLVPFLRLIDVRVPEVPQVLFG